MSVADEFARITKRITAFEEATAVCIGSALRELGAARDLSIVIKWSG